VQRILTAVDFSEGSRQALRSALALAEAFEARLRVLYVDPETFSHLAPSEVSQPRELRTHRLERELVALTAEAGGGGHAEGIETVVRIGAAPAEILAEAAEWGASLLVAGTHGRSAIGRLFLGSVSTKLFHLAPCPLLIVPQESEPKPARILAAVDGSPSTETVLGTALAWSRTLGSEVVVLHVLDQFPEPVLMRLYPEHDLKTDLQLLVEGIRARIEAEVESVFPAEARPQVVFPVGPPYLEVCRHAEMGHFGLVIVGTHEKRGALNLGNTAARIAHHCPCSVLVARS
jgi:nucleotide-binding universal stress UspA family protein